MLGSKPAIIGSFSLEIAFEKEERVFHLPTARIQPIKRHPPAAVPVSRGNRVIFPTCAARSNVGGGGSVHHVHSMGTHEGTAARCGSKTSTPEWHGVTRVLGALGSQGPTQTSCFCAGGGNGPRSGASRSRFPKLLPF